MRIKTLFYALLTLPLFFAACEDTKVDEVKNPTINLVAGTTTEDSISFTVTTTDAEKVAWLVVEESTTTPTATEVFSVGTEIAANTTVEVTATDLEADTDYMVVAAAMNSKTVVKAEVKMFTMAGTAEDKELVFTLTSDEVMEFAAEGGNGEITYTIEWIEPSRTSPVETEAKCSADWVKIDGCTETNTSFRVLANETEEAREATITITYLTESLDVTVKQVAKGGEPVGKEYDVEFVATQIMTDYMNEEGVDFYVVELGDNGWGDNGWGVDGGTYYAFAIIPSSKGDGVLPNGIYSLGSNATSNTILDELSFHYKMVNGVPEGGFKMYKDANLIISDGMVEATIEFEDGSKHRVVFEGDLSVDDGGSQTPGAFEATHTADKWLWGNASTYGNKYMVVGEGFSIDVHFPAQFASKESLEEGEYNWVSTTVFGYTDDTKYFTTRSFNVDGVLTAVDSGKAVVSAEGEEYDIQLTLNGRDGMVYMIEYKGKLNDNGGAATPDVITFTSMSEGTALSYYYQFTLSDDSGDNQLRLVLDSTDSNSSAINARTYSWVSSPSYISSGNFSFVNKSLRVDGIQYANNQVMTGTCEVAVEGNTYTINIKAMVNDAEMTFKYVGTIGEQGTEPTPDPEPDPTPDPEPDPTPDPDPEQPSAFDPWTFTASLNTGTKTLTMTDAAGNTVTAQLGGKYGLSAGTYYINDTDGVFYATDITVNGEAATMAEGTITIDYSYYVTVSMTIDGVKYSGTSSNPVA